MLRVRSEPLPSISASPAQIADRAGEKSMGTGNQIQKRGQSVGLMLGLFTAPNVRYYPMNIQYLLVPPKDISHPRGGRGAYRRAVIRVRLLFLLLPAEPGGGLAPAARLTIV